MRCARPSTIAVPDAGLADEHRAVLRPPRDDLMTRRISSSRPMTGSSLPDSAASAVRSRPYFRAPGTSPRGSCEVSPSARRGRPEGFEESGRAGRRRAREAGDARLRRTRRRAPHLVERRVEGAGQACEAWAGRRRSRSAADGGAPRLGAQGVPALYPARSTSVRGCSRSSRRRPWSGVSSGLPARRASSRAQRRPLPGS